MNTCSRTLLALSTLLLTTSQLHAAAVLVSDFRKVESAAFVGSGFDGSGEDAYPFYEFNYFDAYSSASLNSDGMDAFSEANQNSTVTSTSFTGSLQASGGIVDPNNLGLVFDTANGESSYFIQFDLLTAHSYTLSGDLFYNGGSAGQAASGIASHVASLSLGDISLSSTDSPFSLSGVLQPGSYNLEVYAHVFAAPGESGWATADFDLQISQVPVPAAVWLFASGLLALVGVSRRATQHL